MLFTDGTLNFRRRSGAYLGNAAHFLISTDNREQTFNAGTPRTPLPIVPTHPACHPHLPNYVTEGAIKMREKPGFPGSLSQLGAPRQKARDYAEMCALVSQGAGGGKRAAMNGCFFFFFGVAGI